MLNLLHRKGWILPEMKGAVFPRHCMHSVEKPNSRLVLYLKFHGFSITLLVSGNWIMIKQLMSFPILKTEFDQSTFWVVPDPDSIRVSDACVVNLGYSWKTLNPEVSLCPQGSFGRYRRLFVWLLLSNWHFLDFYLVLNQMRSSLWWECCLIEWLVLSVCSPAAQHHSLVRSYTCKTSSPIRNLMNPKLLSQGPASRVLTSFQAILIHFTHSPSPVQKGSLQSH